MKSFRLSGSRCHGQSAASPKSTLRRYATLHIGMVVPLTLLIVTIPAAAAEEGADVGDVQPTATDPSPVQSNGVPGIADAFSDQWRIQLGAGVLNGPRYPGSGDNFTRGVPAVSISYDRYFFGGAPGSGAPAGLGVFLLRTDHWALGLSAGGDFRKPRRASDAPILQGWGDIPGTVRGGFFASYTLDWLSVHGSVTAAGHDEGVLAKLGVDAKYSPTPRLVLTIGPEITFANNQYAMTFFGVDTAQSQIAGIAPYQARGGVNSVGGSAGASYRLTERWSLAAHVGYERLQGDAADSPVTTDKTQRVFGAFVMYRF